MHLNTHTGSASSRQREGVGALAPSSPLDKNSYENWLYFWGFCFCTIFYTIPILSTERVRDAQRPGDL